MIKKILLAILLTLLPFKIDAQTYNLEDLNLNISFSDDWYVFTRQNIYGNTILKDSDLTEEYMENLFRLYDIYIDALPKDYNLEFFLRIKDVNYVNNLSNYNDDIVSEIALEVGKEVNSNDYTTYNNKYKYIVFPYQDGNFNILSYYTIVNRKGYTFSIQKNSEITEEDNQTMKTIIDSIDFKIEEQYKEESKTTHNIIDWSIVFKHALIGGIIGGIVGGIGQLFIKKINKKQK